MPVHSSNCLYESIWAVSSGATMLVWIVTVLPSCLPSLVLAILGDVWLRWCSGEQTHLGAVLGGLPGFALLPLTGLACVALPALDAHTRLLFGRSLAYQVTEKLPSTSSGTPLARAIVP